MALKFIIISQMSGNIIRKRKVAGIEIRKDTDETDTVVI